MFKRMTMVTAALATLAAAGCEKPKDETPESKPNITVTVPPAPAPVTVTNTSAVTAGDPLAGVANRDQLTPDPKATAIDPPKPAVLVTGLSTTVRQSPSGSRIKVLETTASVKEVQRDGDYFLVTYTDPRSANQLLAGWVYRDSLVGEGSSTPAPGMPRKTGKLACENGESHLQTGRDFCGKTCSEDRDCDSAGGQICDGVAVKIDEKSDQHTNTRFCIDARSANADRGAAERHAASGKSAK
jgi:hypothetical protein